MKAPAKLVSSGEFGPVLRLSMGGNQNRARVNGGSNRGSGDKAATALPRRWGLRALLPGDRACPSWDGGVIAISSGGGTSVLCRFSQTDSSRTVLVRVNGGSNYGSLKVQTAKVVQDQTFVSLPPVKLPSVGLTERCLQGPRGDREECREGSLSTFCKCEKSGLFGGNVGKLDKNKTLHFCNKKIIFLDFAIF